MVECNKSLINFWSDIEATSQDLFEVIKNIYNAISVTFAQSGICANDISEK